MQAQIEREDVTSPLVFWESALSKKKQPIRIEKDFFSRLRSATHERFAQVLGDVSDLDVLDIGCGRGYLSVYLAMQGARVTATDFSEAAIRSTEALAEYNNVSGSINFVHIDAMDLLDLGRDYDLVVGRFVLHHIEPFYRFADVLTELVRYTGRGVFVENNAANPLLMMARNHLVGRLGIPRHGDPEEHPFEQREVDMLQARFRTVRQHFPELVFMRKLNTYVFKEKKVFMPFMAMNDWLDDTLYAALPSMRRLSYLQLIEFGNQ